MNAIARQLTRLTMLAAVIAAGFTTQAAHAASKEVRVVQLQPVVVVVGKRIRVIELERVVVVAKRLTPETVVAQRGARTPRG